MSKYPRSPETCLDAWVEYLKNPKTRGDLVTYEISTIRDYRSAAKIVMDNMAEIDISPLPYRWTAEDLSSIIDYWDEKGLRVKTQKGYHTALCQMARFFYNYAPGDVKVRWPYEEILNKWLEIEEVHQVLRTPMSEIQFLGVELMLRMGRRRIECLRAKVSDMKYDAKDPYMIVDGKGHKKHKMPFAPTTDKILGKWLDKRSEIIMDYAPSKMDTIDDLFIWGRGREVSPFSQRKPNGWDNAIPNDVSIRSKVPFSNHVLRRTFGRELHFSGGVDLLLIQFYYNHASIEQTIHYIGADQKRMSAGMKNMPF